MTDALAVFGVIATVNLVGGIALALYLLRMKEQVRHLKDLVTTIVREYEATTGHRVAVDTALLGEPQDVVAEDGSDVFSRVQEAKPWVVR